jgi:hypothetical protein
MGANPEQLPTNTERLGHRFLQFYLFRLVVTVVRQNELAVGGGQELKAALQVFEVALVVDDIG